MEISPRCTACGSRLSIGNHFKSALNVPAKNEWVICYSVYPLSGICRYIQRHGVRCSHAVVRSFSDLFRSKSKHSIRYSRALGELLQIIDDDVGWKKKQNSSPKAKLRSAETIYWRLKSPYPWMRVNWAGSVWNETQICSLHAQEMKIGCICNCF